MTSCGAQQSVTLVNQIPRRHEQSAAAQAGHGRDPIQRQIDAGVRPFVRSDAQIDRLVYDLYGLTDDEIKLVEEGT